MFYLDKIVGAFIENVKLNHYFDDKRVIEAYPEATKPTLLKSVCVAVGIKEITADENSVGESIKHGAIGIYANIYIPFSVSNACADEVLCQICRAVNDWSIASIAVSEMTADMKTQCRVVKSVLTFNGEFSFGGDDDE